MEEICSRKLKMAPEFNMAFFWYSFFHELSQRTVTTRKKLYHKKYKKTLFEFGRQFEFLRKGSPEKKNIF
jgi:hypothetical protein